MQSESSPAVCVSPQTTKRGVPETGTPVKNRTKVSNPSTVLLFASWRGRCRSCARLSRVRLPLLLDHFGGGTNPPAPFGLACGGVGFQHRRVFRTQGCPPLPRENPDVLPPLSRHP